MAGAAAVSVALRSSRLLEGEGALPIVLAALYETLSPDKSSQGLAERKEAVGREVGAGGRWRLVEAPSRAEQGRDGVGGVLLQRLGAPRALGEAVAKKTPSPPPEGRNSFSRH